MASQSEKSNVLGTLIKDAIVECQKTEGVKITVHLLSKLSGISETTLCRIINGEEYSQKGIKNEEKLKRIKKTGYIPSILYLSKIFIMLGIPFFKTIKKLFPILEIIDKYSKYPGTIEERMIAVDEELVEKGFSPFFSEK